MAQKPLCETKLNLLMAEVRDCEQKYCKMIIITHDQTAVKVYVFCKLIYPFFFEEER